MILLRIGKLPVDEEGNYISNFNHTSTVWEFAKDEAFTEIVDTVIGTNANSMLEHGRSDVVIPDNETYYGRANRIFEEGQESGWIGPVPLTSHVDYQNVHDKRRELIDAPTIKIDDIEDNGTEVTLMLSTSSFRGHDNSQHVATNWIIRNYEDIEIYRNTSSTDLTEILITLDKDLFGTSFVPGLAEQLNVFCAHVSNTPQEGVYGFIIVDTLS